jgi:ankyrin repeat protein
MNTLLIAAVEAGELPDVRKLLAEGAPANTADEASGQSVLMTAAGRGHTEIVEALLKAGADANAVDPRAGATALHKACQGGHLEVVRILVESGALIDHQTTGTGHTPLVEAIWFKAVDIVEYLLGRDARIELRTYYGFSVDDHIQYGLRVNKGVGGEQALRKILTLIEARRAADEKCMTAGKLFPAVLAGDATAVRTALSEGTPLEDRYPIVGGFSDGHTALLIACRDGHTEIVRDLLHAGANPNAVEPVFGAVPLHKSTYNGYLEITQLLAAAPGVDLNYQGPSNGYTPLHDALWHGFADCAAVLLDAGARADIVGYDGRLPVDIARKELGADHAFTARLQSLG